MAHFLLIHGASHGAWCWDRLVPKLEKLGHSVHAIDLPSHGDDTTPPESVTLSDYVEAVVDALDENTILVGHSLGGLSITLAADIEPEKIRALVYLCALIPRPGLPMSHVRREAISSEQTSAQTVDHETGLSHVSADKAADLFYNGCSEDDRAFATQRLSPQPISVMTEVLEFKVPEVPRHYIRCHDDLVVLPVYQTAVAKNCDHTHDMACGHSPFFADPDGLARILDTVANTDRA